MEKDEAVKLEQKLNEIIASKKIIETSRGPFWAYYPTLDNRLYAKYIFNIKLKECKEAGILCAEELLKEYELNDLWSEVKQKNLDSLPNIIKEVEERISRTNNLASQRKLKNWLNSLQNKYSELLNDRNVRLANSAEYIAHEHSSLYLMYSCMRNMDYTNIWPSFQDLENEKDIDLVQELLSLFVLETQDSSEKEIRKLARSSMWRIRWNAFGDSSYDLFGRNSQNLSNDQFMLVYWSQVYDSVYESLERPPDDVIINDEALDKWLLAQAEERSREVGQRFYGKSSSNKINSKINNSNEIFKVVDGYFNEKGEWVQYTDSEKWEQIEKIRSLNSPMARRIKLNEEEKLRKNKGKLIQEHELRKSKEARELMGGNVNIKVNKPKGVR